jgi:Protein of unknown function (DUF1264)
MLRRTVAVNGCAQFVYSRQHHCNDAACGPTRSYVGATHTRSADIRTGTVQHQEEDAVQIRVHHFCSHLNKEVRQCILTDSDEKGARIIGIEYMISKELFETLDAEEKKLWHSHEYEVKSGALAAPELPDAVANIDMADVQNTYGVRHRRLVPPAAGDRMARGCARACRAM